AECPVPFAEIEDLGIVIDAGGSELGVGLFRDLERGADAGDSSDGQVGREAKGPSNLRIAGVLHLDLVGRMDGPTDFGDSVAGGSECGERGVDLVDLIGSRIEFAADGSYALHGVRLYHIN